MHMDWRRTLYAIWIGGVPFMPYGLEAYPLCIWIGGTPFMPYGLEAYPLCHMDWRPALYAIWIGGLPFMHMDWRPALYAYGLEACPLCIWIGGLPRLCLSFHGGYEGALPNQPGLVENTTGPCQENRPGHVGEHTGAGRENQPGLVVKTTEPRRESDGARATSPTEVRRDTVMGPKRCPKWVPFLDLKFDDFGSHFRSQNGPETGTKTGARRTPVGPPDGGPSGGPKGAPWNPCPPWGCFWVPGNDHFRAPPGAPCCWSARRAFSNDFRLRESRGGNDSLRTLIPNAFRETRSPPLRVERLRAVRPGCGPENL